MSKQATRREILRGSLAVAGLSVLRPGNDIYVVYAHNWLNDPTGHRLTLDRGAATKIIYTHRFYIRELANVDSC